MPAGILGDRFWNRGTEPAWHKLGHNFDGYMTASEAFEKAPFEVDLRPVKITLNGVEHDLPYVIPVRSPIPEDNQEVTLGDPVAEGYCLVTPRQACAMWDANVLDIFGKAKGIETFGVLRDGADMFLTTFATPFDVAGDEMKTYFFMHSPNAGNTAATLGFTTVRVVCQNTLQMAIGGARQKTVLRHDKGVYQQLAEWLRRMWETYTHITTTARIDMTAMATRRINDDQAKWITKRILPDPTPIEARRYTYTTEIGAQRYEAELARVEQERRHVFEFFKGAGVAADTKAVAGTLFGLLSAVGELEDNMRTRGTGGAVSTLVGDRMAVGVRAYREALDFMKIPAAFVPHSN